MQTGMGLADSFCLCADKGSGVFSSILCSRQFAVPGSPGPVGAGRFVGRHLGGLPRVLC